MLNLLRLDLNAGRIFGIAHWNWRSVVRRQGRDRRIDRDGLVTTLFVGADGAWVVAAATYELREASCDSEPEVVRALMLLRLKTLAMPSSIHV